VRAEERVDALTCTDAPILRTMTSDSTTTSAPGVSPPPCDIRQLLGVQPTSDTYTEYIRWLLRCSNLSAPVAPEIKSYPDAVYFNYYRLGLSVMFAPRNGYKPKSESKLEDLKVDCLSLDSIDVFHASSAPPARPAPTKANTEYSTFVGLPLQLQLATQPVVNESTSHPTEITFTPTSIGKDIVGTLGEPERKGGGSGSLGIWCEWSKYGVMVEFEARGAQAWEKGKDAPWKSITIFSPKAS
jgi:hypothetical protein